MNESVDHDAVKERLLSAEGDALYELAMSLIGRLTKEDWDRMGGFQPLVHVRLRNAGYDTAKMIAINRKWMASVEIQWKENGEFPLGKDIQEALNEGPRSVMLWILDHYHIATKKEVGTDKEELYMYADGFYSRGEETLRSAIFQRYIDRWNDALLTIKELWKTVDKGNPDKVKELAVLTKTIENLLKKGPTKAKIDETLAQIRLLTFREASEFNPPSHIPFRNGLLRLANWKLVPHTPDLIYLWRVEASLIEDRLNNISLNDCPMYKKFLIDTYEPWDIPMLLQYGGYAFHPTFPRQKVLWNVGRPRVGKGTNARVWKNLNPTGYGAISFEKLMIAENRFAFQGIEGKNLLVDPEVKRNYKKGARPDYGNYNKLFGGDTVDLEEKNKKTTEYVSRAKGLFLANLPIPRIDDEPFLSRVLLVKSRDRIISNEERIANLDEKIVEAERDQIATLFMRYLKVLSSQNWNFISELSTDATMEMWDMFSDAVQHYLEEMISFQEGAEIKCDDMYDSFSEWCKAKGIPVMRSQSFKKSVSYIYTKAKRGTKKSRYYVFMNCVFSDENEIEVGHQSNFQENRNIRASYYRYRLCPTSVPIFNMKKEEENHDRIKIPKLDTSIFTSPDARNTAPQEKKMVSNLFEDPETRIITRVFDRDANILVRFNMDMKISYYDRNAVFHAGDIAYIPQEWIPPLTQVEGRIDILKMGDA